MMGSLDSGRTCFAMHGETYASSQTDEIMSKYRPIAPKPTFHITSNSLCKSNCNPNFVLGCSPTFSTTHKGNNNAKSGNGGHNRSGHRRRAADFSKSPSPRVLKRARGTNIPTDESRTHDIVGASVPADGPGIGCHFQGSFSAEKSTFEKPELEVMERTAAAEAEEEAFKGFEGCNMKSVMKSIGKVGTLENPATNIELVTPVPKMAETQCGCGSANYFVFPIVSETQQEEEANQVTLPLLPEEPGSVLGSSGSYLTSTDHKSNNCNASCDKEDIPLRLFGIDFSHKEVRASPVSTDESLEPENFVPFVGLSFL